MTREQTKHYMPFIQAWADGKQVQWKPTPLSEWEDVNWFNFPDFDKICVTEYSKLTPMRIKPEPSYREWKPEEVPVGALIKNPYLRTSIIAVDKNGLTYCGHCDSAFTTSELLAGWVITIDYGKTWQPCGVPVV